MCWLCLNFLAEMCFLSLPCAFYFLSKSSTYRIPYQWKEFVICHQNKTMNSLEVLSGQGCLLWNPESGVRDTKHIPFLQLSCRQLLTQHEGWVQKSTMDGQLEPGAWILGTASLNAHVLMSVYLLKRIWIKLQMHFFLHCSLTSHDW